MGTVTFKDTLELVESLSDDERWSLIEIVRRRLVEGRRSEIAKNVTESREDLTKGKVTKGSVDDLLRGFREYNLAIPTDREMIAENSLE